MSTPSTPQPDMLFRGGRVMTGHGVLDDEQSVVAVRDGVISATGGADLLDTAGPATTVIDLDGRTLLPGVNDGHLHIGGYGSGRPPASLDLSPANVSTIADIVDLVAERARSTPPGTWIRGRGWSAAHLSDLPGAEPTASLIDHVTPDHPIVLIDFSGHAMWVNSEAMRLAGLDRSTPIPTGGVARRDGNGELTGLIAESAQNLISAHIPVLSDAELEVAVRSALGELHRQGITSMTDAALNPLPGIEDSLGGTRVFELLQRICNPHDVPMRTNALVTFSPIGSSLLTSTVEGLAAYNQQVADRGAETDPAWFNVRGLKVFADGVPPNCTSWMHGAYPDGGHGCLTVGGDTDADRIDELRQIIEVGHRAGLQVGVHVTGDRATEAVVDGFVAALETYPRDDPRHYMIHGPLASPADLQRASAAGIGINVQPTLKATSAQAIEAMFGREMSEYQWPLRTIVDSGTTMAASSDAPVTSPNWRTGVATAMLREAPDGEVFGAEQRLRIGEVVHAYTLAGAWQDNAESWKGSIEIGKVADLCVVDGDLVSDDPHNIAAMEVSLTTVAGQIVHGDDLTG